MSEIIRYNESERLALHSWLRNIQKLQEGSTGMDKTVEFTPYNVLIKMVVAEIFFSARQIDNTGLHSHPILLYPTSQLHYKLHLTSDTNVFVAPVVKSTLVPLKPILCSPGGKGFNIIHMPSDTACVWPGDIPKMLFSGNVKLNSGDCIRNLSRFSIAVPFIVTCAYVVWS